MPVLAWLGRKRMESGKRPNRGDPWLKLEGHVGVSQARRRESDMDIWKHSTQGPAAHSVWQGQGVRYGLWPGKR